MQIVAIKPDYDKPNPKVGVSSIQFSMDNRYAYTRNGQYGVASFSFDACVFIRSFFFIYIYIHMYMYRHNAKHLVDLGHDQIQVVLCLDPDKSNQSRRMGSETIASCSLYG
jgi:hypothetical protein